MATGWPMKTTYADGDVYAAQDVNDITGTINLLQTSTLSMAAGKNAIINGGFDIWQRGTSFTSVGYTADRWYGAWTGTVTLTRQTSGAPIGSQYYLRQVSGANGSIIDLIQFIETANVIPMQGKTVTLSFKVRRNASLLSNFSYFIQKSATVDAGAGASWTTVQTGSFANASIPTGTTINDWYSASASFTIPTDGTANSIRIVLEPSSQMPINSSFDLAQVQLELGSTATTFSRAGSTLGGELAACQRYLPSVYGGSFAGYAYATNSILYAIPFPVTARKAATGITVTGTWTGYALNSGANFTPTFNLADISGASIDSSGARTITAGQGSRLESQGGVILFTGCEL